MSLLINLTPAEEAQLSDAASETGMAPEAYITKLVREHLPVVSITDELHKKLRERQQQDRIHLMPTRTASEIFAEWDRQAALMTNEERNEEARFWEEFQKSINQTRAELGMRQL